MIYRVYFNRCEDFPQIWSVDEGSIDTEVNVIGFRLPAGAMHGCVADFGSVHAAREPKAWVEVEADSLRIVGGCAVFG